MTPRLPRQRMKIYCLMLLVQDPLSLIINDFCDEPCYVVLLKLWSSDVLFFYFLIAGASNNVTLLHEGNSKHENKHLDPCAEYHVRKPLGPYILLLLNRPGVLSLE